MNSDDAEPFAVDVTIELHLHIIALSEEDAKEYVESVLEDIPLTLLSKEIKVEKLRERNK